MKPSATPDPLPTAKPRAGRKRRRGPTGSYEMRVCDGCGRESLPRKSRPVRSFEVGCGCGCGSFTVYPLQVMAGHASVAIG